ncbi:MAG: pilus assembly protein PilX [Methylococcaceae bacterium]|nr:pilus assembly protein PilX [Methylococcaceae bacterium]
MNQNPLNTVRIFGQCYRLAKKRPFIPRPQQTGAVLAISLVILVLLTIIGISAAQFTGLEEKMAGNLRDRNLAFQAAETALREAEEKTADLLPCPIAQNLGLVGFYAYNDAPIIDDSPGNVWSTAGKALTALANLEGSTKTAQPQYIIQCITSAAGGSSVYRITARGTGGTTDAVVTLQSVFER